MKSCFHFKILYNFSGIKLVKKELQVLIVLHLKNLQQNSLKWKFIIIRFYFLMTTWNSNTQFVSKITQKIHDKIHEKYYQTEKNISWKNNRSRKKRYGVSIFSANCAIPPSYRSLIVFLAFLTPINILQLEIICLTTSISKDKD